MERAKVHASGAYQHCDGAVWCTLALSMFYSWRGSCRYCNVNLNRLLLSCPLLKLHSHLYCRGKICRKCLIILSLSIHNIPPTKKLPPLADTSSLTPQMWWHLHVFTTHLMYEAPLSKDGFSQWKRTFLFDSMQSQAVEVRQTEPSGYLQLSVLPKEGVVLLALLLAAPQSSPSSLNSCVLSIPKGVERPPVSPRS